MIGMMIVLTGCGGGVKQKVNDEESALALLQAIEGYEAQVNVVFFSNKGENAYRVHQRVNLQGNFD